MKDIERVDPTNKRIMKMSRKMINSGKRIVANRVDGCKLGTLNWWETDNCQRSVQMNMGSMMTMCFVCVFLMFSVTSNHSLSAPRTHSRIMGLKVGRQNEGRDNSHKEQKNTFECSSKRTSFIFLCLLSPIYLFSYRIVESRSLAWALSSFELLMIGCQEMRGEKRKLTKPKILNNLKNGRERANN